MSKLLSLLPLAAVLTASTVMHADTLNGKFSVYGDLTDTGTSLNFLDASTSAASQTFTGSFATLLTPGETVNASNATLNYSPFVAGSEVFTIGALTVTLESFAANAAGMFNGTALLSAAGYDDTMANIQLTTQTFSGPVSFSATTLANTAQAPEPSTLALFGTGGLGLAGLIRRRFVRA